MDLTKSFPRSPKEKMGGLMWLPRIIDKARADIAGKLGEYNYNCPLDQRLFQFLGIDADSFRNAMKNAGDDAAVQAWLKSAASQRSDAAVEEFNRMLCSLGPSTEDAQKKYAATRDKLAPGRADIKSWIDLIDLEEGRAK